MFALLLAGQWLIHWYLSDRAHRDRQSLDRVRAGVRRATLSLSGRRVYAYSVIRGGAYSAGELDAALQSDPVALIHYADFRRSQAKTVESPQEQQVYVSYRKNDAVYWTSHRVRIPKGEVLLSDGTNYARARCGNRISLTPRQPTSAQEPPPGSLDQAEQKVASGGPSEPWDSLPTIRPAPALAEIFQPYNLMAAALPSGPGSGEAGASASGTGAVPPDGSDSSGGFAFETTRPLLPLYLSADGSAGGSQSSSSGDGTQTGELSTIVDLTGAGGPGIGATFPGWPTPSDGGGGTQGNGGGSSSPPGGGFVAIVQSLPHPFSGLPSLPGPTPGSPSGPESTPNIDSGPGPFFNNDVPGGPPSDTESPVPEPATSSLVWTALAAMAALRAISRGVTLPRNRKRGLRADGAAGPTPDRLP